MFKRKKYPFLILFFTGILCSSCSLLHTPESKVDYEMIEKTAAAHITQTFEALPTNTPTFTPEPTSTFTPEPTATAIPLPTEEPIEYMITRNEDTNQVVPTEIPEPTATVFFPDKADFVSVLPSPNQFVPGQRFYLTWQIKNTGTSTWSGKYRFYYSNGIQLADQSTYSITETVAPGAILTITMPATAPSSEGTYQTTWTLENAEGIPFYYVYYTTIVGDQTFITAVPELNPSATPSTLEWMCSDPERSKVQGDGCTTFCTNEMIDYLVRNGADCYANGERVLYGQ